MQKNENHEDLIVIGRNPVLELLKSDRTIEKIYVLQGVREGSITKIFALAKNKGISIEEANKKKLDTLSNGELNQGVVAIASPVVYYSVEEIIKDCRDKNKRILLLICDDIEDPHNLGALLRCADGSGCDGVIVGKRRTTPITQTVIKTSAGAYEYVKIAKVSNIANTIDVLKENNIWVYAADGNGTEYTKMNFDCDVALVVGNEGKGISSLVKEKCDGIVSIPMYGGVSSLNVSTAAAVLLYDIAIKQRK